MSTASVQKRPCCKCDKGGGVFTCDGCHRSFCRKHTDEHRQELSVQMDNIGQEHDVLQRDLNKETHPHPLLSDIEKWERESIEKIQQVARQVRADLQGLIDRSKKDLKTSLNQLTNELHSCRDSEDYTELDLTRWIDQLQQLRNELERPFYANLMDDDNNGSIIRFIKLSELRDSHSIDRSVRSSAQANQRSTKSTARTPERFNQIDKKSPVSENGLLATCPDRNNSTVYGTQRYSSGVHPIHFRIEQKYSKYLFFGIVTQSKAGSSLSHTAPSANGYWDFEIYVKSGILHNNSSIISMQSGDEVTLILDCDRRQIHFQHHRTQKNATMDIDLQNCPFPWIIIVALRTPHDRVRILDNNDSP